MEESVRGDEAGQHGGADKQPQEPTSSSKGDPEILALAAVQVALSKLAEIEGGTAAVRRVISWAESRYLNDAPGWVPRQSQVPAQGGGSQGGRLPPGRS